MDHNPGPFTGTAPFAEWHPPLSDREAVVEARACLQCGGPYAPAPCVVACPAGIDVPGFIADIVDGRPLTAARRIFTENILGGSCARVCPVEVLCEGKCVLLREGRRAIEIGRLQRYATDRAMEVGSEPDGDGPTYRSGVSIGVVGAGAAGLACAAELARLGYAVTVYEQRRLAGGLITHGIAPYKQLVDPLPQEVENIRRLGVQFCFGVTVGRDVTAEDLRRKHRAVFIGVGMGADLPAKIPGEDLPGVWESLRFIEAVKLGRPGEVEVGSRIAVIGGGNTAIDVAREAVMLGATDVMMLYRRTEAQMPAYAHEIAAAKAEGVRIVALVAPLEFVGDGCVTGVRCIRMELGPPDRSGRPKPVPLPGSEFVIDVDMAVTAIGQAPRTELLELLGIKAPDGKIGVDEEMRVAGGAGWCFAGGDCINGGATVVEAVRDGKLAARAIDRSLTGRVRPRPMEAPPPDVVCDNGTVKHFQGASRLNTAPGLCKGCDVCVTGCPSDTLALDASDRIVVKNANMCVFCGLCEARCPDFAIWIVKGAHGAEAFVGAASEGTP